MSDSFYHITESDKLNLKKKFKTFSFGHVLYYLFIYFVECDLWRHEILPHTCVRQENS